MTRQRLNLKISGECCEQLEELSETLNISRTAVIAQAVAKMYLTEKALVQKKRKSRRGNGARPSAFDAKVDGLTGAR